MRFTDNDVERAFDGVVSQYRRLNGSAFAADLKLVPGADNPVSGRTSWHVTHGGQAVLTLGATRRLAYAALVNIANGLSLTM